MAKTHARNASIYLDSTAGASTSFSADLNTCTLDLTAEAPEVTGFGDNTVQRLSNGITDWTFSCDGFFNDSANSAASQLFLLMAGSTYLQYGPTGSTSGSRKMCASAVVTSMNISNEVNGAIAFSFEIQGRSGSITASSW
jgi:hypothetical protein